MATDIARIAKLFVDAHRANTVFEVPAEPAFASDADTYPVQDAVFRQLWPGERPAAWKVGAPNDKVEPAASPIRFVHRSPASVSAAGMQMIGVEAEIAYRIGRALPARARPYMDEEIADAVEEIVVAIELCDTRLAGWKNAPPLWKLADFQSNAALIAGSGTRNWRAIDFARQEVELVFGGKTKRASGAHPFGNPFRLLPWTAVHCARRGGGLRAGDIVTTGSWTGIDFVARGDLVVARFPGIGEAQLRIE
jgi:2-keto-4-pentenoate hydratase